MTSVPSHVRMMSQLMQTAELRHRVISQNIANVNTPNYRSLDVEFEAELVRQLAAGGPVPEKLPAASIRVEEGLPERFDGNNVDFDREIGRLNKNALLYQTYAQVTANYYDTMRRAMRTG